MRQEKLTVSNPVLGNLRVESDNVARTIEDCGSKVAVFFGKVLFVGLGAYALIPVAKKAGTRLANLIDRPKKQTPAATPPTAPPAYTPPKTMQQLIDEARFDSEEQRQVAGGLLRKDDHILLAAAQKTGKSMLMMDIARSTASGTPLTWLPPHMQTTGQQPMHVFYYDGEMKPDEYKLRYGNAPDTFSERLRIVTDTPQGIQPFFDRMERDLQHPLGDTLVLIDNYSAIVGEYTPKAAGEYRQHIEALQEQFRRRGHTLAVVSAFHTLKDDAKTHYGSSQFANLSDGQIYLEQDPTDPDCVILTMPHTRGANPLRGESIRLKRIGQPSLHFERQPSDADATTGADMPEAATPPKTTKEQRDAAIRDMRAQGHTNEQVAEKYGVTPRTVQNVCNGYGNRA